MNRLILASAMLISLAATAQAEPTAFDGRIDGLARTWAHVNYEVPEKAAEVAQAAKLASEADQLAKQNPTRAEPLVWEAIAVLTEAGARGGLGGLSLAKNARQLLEQAERINPTALGDGSVYTSLGSLYAQVPGFPVGFGDPVKARSYLQKAIKINPAGIDPNYFLGDFLLRQGDAKAAVTALEHALAAPPRPGREVADKGRRGDAASLLAQARRKAAG